MANVLTDIVKTLAPGVSQDVADVRQDVKNAAAAAEQYAKMNLFLSAVATVATVTIAVVAVYSVMKKGK